MRTIIGNILVVLSTGYTVYLSIIMIRRINAVVLKDAYIKVFLYELIACGFFLLFALDVRLGVFTRMNPPAFKAVGWCLRAAVILVTAIILFFLGKVMAGSFICTEASAKYAIVLGLALENGKPVQDLISRLDTAGKYLHDNPDAILILTGGNPDASGVTEAASMRNILMSRGVPEEKMILEDLAETTKANFRNTALLLRPDEPVVLISSNYHMDRAVHTAKRAGFTNVLRLPAPSSFLFFGANVMWEAVLELNELTLNHES